MAGWDLILVVLGGEVAFLAAFAWVAKKVISHQLTKDVERYRSELEAANARSIEQLRHELHVEAVKDEVRFRSVHAKVAEVVAEAHGKLSLLIGKALEYIRACNADSEQPREPALDAFAKAVWDFSEYVVPRQIYFRLETGKKLMEAHDIMMKVVSSLEKQMRKTGSISDLAEEHLELAAEVLSKMNDLNLVLRELRNTFQKLIGLDALLGKEPETLPGAAPG